MTMHRTHLFSLSLLFLLAGAGSRAQTPDVPPQSPAQGTPPSEGRRPGRGGSADARNFFGKIMAVNSGSIQLAKADGTSVFVKLTDKTEFRKNRQPAKIDDFKVGDFVLVRGDENADHTVTAQVIGGRAANAPGVEGGLGGGAGFGEMGKDFVAGEVKSIDAPKLIIVRTDSVTQTIELNEETSLRKGRDSITMADIQPSDHLVVRGVLQNNVFVPKNVMVLSPQQWQRMQEMGMGRGGPPGNPPAGAPNNNPPQQ